MCPKCKSSNVRRSRTKKFFDGLMMIAGLLAYRCRDCNRRFYVTRLDDKRLQMLKQRENERLAQIPRRRAGAASELTQSTPA